MAEPTPDPVSEAREWAEQTSDDYAHDHIHALLGVIDQLTQDRDMHPDAVYSREYVLAAKLRDAEAERDEWKARWKAAVELADQRTLEGDDLRRLVDQHQTTIQAIRDLAIWESPDRCGGTPCIRGTRVPVETITDLTGDSEVPDDQVPDYYPGVQPWQAALTRILKDTP